MSTFDEIKQARRRELKAARSALSVEERASIDAGIAAKLFELPEYEQAELLLPYLSFGAEIDTREIIRDAWSRGKTVALPRCVEGTRLMRWFVVDSFDGLVKSSFGVDEPACDPEREIDPSGRSGALVIVPGLEFDRLGFRLGYGGGFYDTFLASFEGASAGLCRSQFLSDVPIEHDVHDLPAKLVVTQDAVYRP